MLNSSNEEMSSENAETSKRIKLNASGTKFEITFKSFSNFPAETRLGKLSNFHNMSHFELCDLCDEFDLRSNEFFFERDPIILQMVLNYFKTGELHINTKSCEIFIANELNYWMIDLSKIKHCCKSTFDEKHEAKSDFIQIGEQVAFEIQNMHKKLTIKETLWYITEFPWSSRGAMVILFVA